MLEMLTRPVAATTGEGAVTWSLSRTPLFPSGGDDFLTEHSERKGLASMAAARGIARERCDMIGRWSDSRPQGSSSSKDYVQTEADIVTGCSLKSWLVGPLGYLVL